MYAEPIIVDNPAACSFYHRMDIPGHGTVGNQWDLRSMIDEYLGNLDFAGKRVLDVGAASGYLSFEMERRGAEVVSFDMVDGRSWDLVPHAYASRSLEELADKCVPDHAAMQNAYWFAHRRFGSSAKVYYGDIYNLPAELGSFDIVLFGMILGHLRDPFQALYSGSRLCTGNVVVTNQSRPSQKKWYGKTREPEGAQFIPTVDNEIQQAWWALSDQCITQMLEVLGFATTARFTTHPECLVGSRSGTEECRTTVTERIAGEVVGMETARQECGA